MAPCSMAHGHRAHGAAAHEHMYIYPRVWSIYLQDAVEAKRGECDAVVEQVYRAEALEGLVDDPVQLSVRQQHAARAARTPRLQHAVPPGAQRGQRARQLPPQCRLARPAIQRQFPWQHRLAGDVRAAALPCHDEREAVRLGLRHLRCVARDAAC
eukprot:360082-Chlamydomonas_euryale.AAC.3